MRTLILAIPLGYVPALGFTFSLPSSYHIQHIYTAKQLLYSHPNLTCLYYTTTDTLLITHLTWFAQEVRESKIDNINAICPHSVEPDAGKVQWVGIRERDTHTHTYTQTHTHTQHKHTHTHTHTQRFSIHYCLIRFSIIKSVLTIKRVISSFHLCLSGIIK